MLPSGCRFPSFRRPANARDTPMNVNGSRKHVFLSEADWGRCFAAAGADEAFVRLDAMWRQESAAGESHAPVVWDKTRAQLRLANRSIGSQPTANEAIFVPDARRTAAADRAGNIYWIADDRRSLRVRSAGDRREGVFWPPAKSDGTRRAVTGDFSPVATTPGVVMSFDALVVTEDHYLVVAVTRMGRSALLAFDLTAGGPPAELVWEAALPLSAFDMARRCGGGLWILDRNRHRLWELDRNLALADAPADTSPPPGTASSALFQPLKGPRRPVVAVEPPSGTDLAELLAESSDPIALEVTPDGAILILDRRDGVVPSHVIRLHRHKGRLVSAGDVALDRPMHDFVVGTAVTADGNKSPPLLLVAPVAGQAAQVFAIGADAGPFSLQESFEPFPLRRFGGRALLAVGGAAHYDSGSQSLRWVPIVGHRRARFVPAADLLTYVLDAREPGCVWDRVMLDACIPSNTRLEIAGRSDDERAVTEYASPEADPGTALLSVWKEQPAPYLRPNGAELPWLRQPSTDMASGRGTWELLLQGMRGRYLQLRVRLRGDGTHTPAIHALRVWYPRFSYSERFLPSVYREDAIAGDFLDRFLANFEGINTGIEDKIAQAQALFDPRTAPAEALDWLAEWFDVVLDQGWEERRRRLFIRHAMDFFRWRGTVHGLQMLLTLAFDPNVDAQVFADPDAACQCPQSFRIVEAYLTRQAGPRITGDVGAANSTRPQELRQTLLWTSAEGNAGLVERFARSMQHEATPAEQLAAFPLYPPADDAAAAAAWSSFCNANLGFVPTTAADERSRWQCFLRMRYGEIRIVAERHGIDYRRFGDIGLPRDWPDRAPIADDWQAFSDIAAETLPHGRWQSFLAHRYRRINILNRAHQTTWPSFATVALPGYLPETSAGQTDWLQFERQLMPMAQLAHRFSVLLPVSSARDLAGDSPRRLLLARRLVAMEKPAHTVFDVRLYWALNRLGEARLGLDTLLGAGSRAPELVPDAILGQSYIGASFVGGATAVPDDDRRLLLC